MSEFKKFKRSAVAEMRPVTDEDIQYFYSQDQTLFVDGNKVSISNNDLVAGSPVLGDMIARNPADHTDKWLVAAEYFSNNFEEMPEYSPGAAAPEYETSKSVSEKNVEKFEGLSGPNIDLVFPNRSYVQFDSEEAILAAIADRFGFERNDFKMISGIHQIGESVTVDCWRMVGKFKASVGGFNFGKAVEFAKAGKKVARAGWNGKDMFVYYVPAASYPAMTDIGREIANLEGKVNYRSYLALKTAQDDVATWAPSGSDALAEDWMIVD